MIGCIHIYHISTTMVVICIFVLSWWKAQTCKKLILYFTFEILNYAIKYNFNMKTIVVIFGSHDKL